jgi:predicted nucleic acid-binding Zn finger protein
MKATATVLAKVEDVRFRKALEGIRGGHYRVTLTFRSDEEVRGLVQTANGKAYGCTLTPVGAFCSCPDALYRGVICKHAVVLAVIALREASSLVRYSDVIAQPVDSSPAPDLRLVKVRRDFAFSP